MGPELSDIVVIHERERERTKGAIAHARKDVITDFSANCKEFLEDYYSFATQRYGEKGEEIVQAITEAVINIAEHANSGLPTFQIGVDTIEFGNTLYVGFAHNGKRFDPRVLMYSDPKPMQHRGWGTTLMKANSQKIEFIERKGRSFYVEFEIPYKA